MRTKCRLNRSGHRDRAPLIIDGGNLRGRNPQRGSIGCQGQVDPRRRSGISTAHAFVADQGRPALQIIFIGQAFHIHRDEVAVRQIQRPVGIGQALCFSHQVHRSGRGLQANRRHGGQIQRGRFALQGIQNPQCLQHRDAT